MPTSHVPSAPTPASAASSSAGNPLVERNIQSLLTRQQQQERSRTLQDRVAEKVTRFAGTPSFVYLHLLLVGGWVVINLGWTPLPSFDPTFVVLAMVASVESIFLATFVLINQNRMTALADARANLDLQINLLAEHEVTQILKLVTHIAERIGVESQVIRDFPELAQEVQLDTVMDIIEAAEKAAGDPPHQAPEN